MTVMHELVSAFAAAVQLLKGGGHRYSVCRRLCILAMAPATPLILTATNRFVTLRVNERYGLITTVTRRLVDSVLHSGATREDAEGGSKPCFRPRFSRVPSCAFRADPC
jgi:hypothetical protein